MSNSEKVYYLPIPTGQHVFIHYKEAIREAVYLRTEFAFKSICNNNPMPTHFFFKVAGVEEEVAIEGMGFNWNKPAYYSLKDAKASENPIKAELVHVTYFNRYTEKCFFSDNGIQLLAWVWNVTEPHCYSVGHNSTFIFKDNKITLKGGTIQDRWFKTKEECLANNEAKVVTF